MIDLGRLRSAIAEAFSDLEASERVYNEAVAGMSERSRGARQKLVTDDDLLEQFILEARTQSESTLTQARQLLNAHGLSTLVEPRFSIPPGVTADQMQTQIEQLVTLCRELLAEMRSSVTMLEAERAKWWKFW